MPARDAFDPAGGTYPAFPRDSQGHPFWSDSELTDKDQVDEHGVTMPYAPMPRGMRNTKDPATGGWVKVDVTPRTAGGVPINPPNL
jgi:hypothetical protein